MWETIKKEWQAQVAILIFLLLATWGIIGLLSPDAYKTRYLGDFPSIYGIMALWGGIFGIAISNKWGSYKSVIGKSILMFSLGLFAQEFGQIMYAYFSFILHIEAPYPSLGDIGYFGSIPLYILGAYYLAKASGVKIGLRTYKSKIQAIIVPTILLITGYYLFLQGYKFDWSNPLKVFLDFGYPLGQAIYVSIALLTYLLSRGILGGVMKSKVLFILFALFIQFLSDYTFLLQTSNETWQIGGINDFMYLTSYFLMTVGLLQLGTVATTLKQEK